MGAANKAASADEALRETIAELEQWVFLVDSGQIKGNGLHAFTRTTRALIAKTRAVSA